MIGNSNRANGNLGEAISQFEERRKVYLSTIRITGAIF